jgi:hypothetical protein
MPYPDEHCTNPRCRGAPAHDQIAAMIRKCGQVIMAVMGDGENPSFAYTIGRTERGQPELLVLVPDSEQLMELGGLLDYLGPRDVKDGHLIDFREGEVFAAVDLNKFPEMQDAAHEDFVVQADLYYGHPVDVLFLVPMEGLELHVAPEEGVLVMDGAPGLH